MDSVFLNRWPGSGGSEKFELCTHRTGDTTKRPGPRLAPNRVARRHPLPHFATHVWYRSRPPEQWGKDKANRGLLQESR